MTVKSRFNYTTVGGPFFLALAFIAITVYYLTAGLSPDRGGSGDTTLHLALVIFNLVLVVAIIAGFVKYAYFIEINDESLIYKNLLTRKESRYRLSELDGYITRKRMSRTVVTEFLVPVKGGARLKAISSYYYANYNELKKALRIPQLK